MRAESKKGVTAAGSASLARFLHRGGFARSWPSFRSVGKGTGTFVSERIRISFPKRSVPCAVFLFICRCIRPRKFEKVSLSCTCRISRKTRVRSSRLAPRGREWLRRPSAATSAAFGGRASRRWGRLNPPRPPDRCCLFVTRKYLTVSPLLWHVLILFFAGGCGSVHAAACLWPKRPRSWRRGE